MAAALINQTTSLFHTIQQQALSNQPQISEFEGQLHIGTYRQMLVQLHTSVYLGRTSRSGKSNPAWYAELLLIVQIDYKEDISQSLRDFSYFQSQVSALQPCSLGTIQYFLCKLRMKPFMHLVIIVIFPLFPVFIKPTKIIKDLHKGHKTLIFQVIFQC